jgi:hypothetical protein
MFGRPPHVLIYPANDSAVSADQRQEKRCRWLEDKGGGPERDDVGSPFFSRNGNAIGTGAGEHARFCQGAPITPPLASPHKFANLTPEMDDSLCGD